MNVANYQKKISKNKKFDFSKAWKNIIIKFKLLINCFMRYLFSNKFFKKEMRNLNKSLKK